jgi:hypothetical protein
MNLRKQAEKINFLLFNNAIDLSMVQFEKQKEIIEADNIAGITYAFKTKDNKRLSVVYIFTKYCKGKSFTYRVLMHELVHVFQNQLKMPINHNGALMRYYCKKARKLGFEIDMRRF